MTPLYTHIHHTMLFILINMLNVGIELPSSKLIVNKAITKLNSGISNRNNNTHCSLKSETSE